MTKHTYTTDSFPTNTGSLSRPARFNLRLTCEARARTWKVLSALGSEYGVSADCLADVWENVGLLILEHHIRNVRSPAVPAALKALIRAEAGRISPQDRERQVYLRLKRKYEKA